MSILQCCSSCCLFLALENAPCGVTTESARQPASRTARVVLSPQHHTHVSRALRLDGRCSPQAFHAVSWTRIHSGNPLSWRVRSSWSTQIFPLPARLPVRRLDRPFSLTDQHLRSFRTAAINSQELDPWYIPPLHVLLSPQQNFLPVPSHQTSSHYLERLRFSATGWIAQSGFLPIDIGGYLAKSSSNICQRRE